MRTLTHAVYVIISIAVIFATPERVIAQAIPTQLKLWEAPEWKRCLQKFKATVKSGLHPKVQTFYNGNCLPKEKATRPANGECFMEAVGPSDLFSATGVEVKLVCVNRGGDDMICTNKSGHYMSAMTAGMKSDVRCEGFPDLLAVNMKKAGPNKALDKILGPKKNNSIECQIQIRKIKRVENDPLFDSNRSIRRLWSYEVGVGEKMGCTF